jgi:hypothetical protein
MKNKVLFLMLVLTCVYSLAYATEDVFVFDISGTYTEFQDDMTLSYTLIQDAEGKLTGSGNLDYSSHENDISIDFDIKGKVKGKNNIVTLKYKVKGEGYAYISGEYTDAKLEDKVSLELDESGGSLVGTVNRKICAKGLGCEKTEADVSVDVLDGMTGNSTLLIDLDSDEKGKKLKGAATLTLSNGDTYNLYVKGKYNSKNDEMKFSLKGSDEESKAVKIKLTIDAETMGCTFFSGKVLGQSLKYKLG